MSDLPLAGVRVLEIGGGIAAGFATRWMAGFGADVVRSEGPPGALTSDEQVYLLAGKRRVDVPDASLRELALAADILVEDGRPGALASRGLGAEALRREKPFLVVTSITPFGQTGPYSAFDATNLISFAMGGIMSLTGRPERPPLVSGGSQAIYLGGFNAFGASLAAYYGALVHGEGDWLDISLQEAAAGMLELYGPRTEVEGGDPGMRAGNHISAVWGIYPVVDGYAGVCCLARQVPAFFRVLGDPELMEERFLDPMQRLEHDDDLQARVFAWFIDKTRADVLALGPENKIPFGAVWTPADLLENESLAERGYFDEVQVPGDGTARVPGRPFLGFPWRAGKLSSAGADTQAVMHEWTGVRA